MRTDDRLDGEVAVERDLPLGSTGNNDRTIDLGALQSLDLQELRSRWVTAYGAEPLPRLSRELLIRGIAYRLQERARGGVTKKVLRMLEQVASGKGKSDAVSNSSMRLGTRLVREWQGRAHEVIVVNGGFLWSGNTYRSLSEIARLITGTRWSGPRFFGLKDGGHRGANGDG